MANMHCSNLPTELWISISNFLTTQETYKLYPVNRALLNLALNTKYRKIILFVHIKDVQRAKAYLQHLSQPHIVSRIQECQILGFTFKNFLPHILSILHNKYRIASKLPLRFGSIIDARLRSPDVFELARRLISAIPAITTLDLLGHHYAGPELFCFIRNTWDFMTPRLQSLVITASLEEFAFYLDESIAFPHLTELNWRIECKLWLSSNACLYDYDRSSVIVGNFLSSCAGGLRKLIITIARPEALFPEPSPFFFICDALKRASNISSLDICTYPVDGRNLALLRGLIHRNASKIINLGVPPLDTLPTIHSRKDHGLPFMLNSTRHLSIRNSGSHLRDGTPNVLGTAELYLDDIESLSSFSLEEQPLFLSELSSFLGRVHTKPSLQSLRSLHLWMYSICPRLFRELATAFPHLHHLALVRHVRMAQDATLASYENADTNRWNAWRHPENPSCLTEVIMDEEPLDWGLKSLYLQVSHLKNHGHWCDAESALSATLRKFIPTLVSIAFTAAPQ